MAERPLYTLYKNLKAQNYDVPDDYNKFESALTRDGKGGADNRHAIYENLKAQNFDVPSTYERFYSALFEPRSKTSSRAKGGSVPMSAADRARFSAGAAAISASAQQTMNNSGRYNRLKQRKQKQQKDFGRVNLGTHQTPYGGDANNVVKDDFAYNPETGKTGAYVTSDNENVYSLPEAEQMQAILDKQNDAYQVAVDTGEIPSAFDVRDKNGNYDLQENIGKNGTYLTEEGAQKQFDKKLADAYARKKEIEALIAEDNRQHGNPLLSYGASIGAGNGRTAEQSDYRNKLATSLSLVTEQIGALEAVKQYPTSSWGEDALKALDNTAFTAKTWDFGLTDFATMGQMERIKTKMDNNIPLSGSDKMLLKSKLGADAAAALEDEKMGNVYRWTKIAGQSLPFMADFFLTGGYGGITKGISRGALKIAAKRGMGKVSAAILKNTGIVAGDVIGSYAMAGTEQALKTGADIMQRHLGNLYQDEKGDYKFGTFDENGNLLHEGGESIGTALYKGMTSAMVENYTEKLFGHNYGIKKGAVNFMEKHGMNASAEFFKNIGKSGWYTNSKKWMGKFGINGFAEEVMEEEIGIPLHALLDGEGKVSDLLDAKQQLDIIGGMAISVGSMYAMGAGSRPVKGIYNRAQYYRFRNKVNLADSDAQNLMGDNWADIKDKIDNATNEQMGSVLADILRQRDTMTKEQINAAVNYGVNLMKMRGYNIAKTAEMNAKEITNEPTTPEEQHQADIDNAYSEGHDADDADKHDIQIQQEDQMKTLAAALGISEQQLSAMSDEELESLTGQNDKLDQDIYDYQLSSARYQGVVDDAQDKVDLAAHQAEQRVDMYTDQSRGSVRNATIKASGGLEDYGVYIISGNIATHDDGSIDVSNSDGMILYYDPTTNSVEHADALMFAELGEELPADDVKVQAVADAKENAIKEVAGIIDGTVEVGSQFNVTDTDGTEHTYEVLADYGDGTAAISIDGNVVENPYSIEDLQQMKDLEDQKRLQAAKAEREQMEKERDAQQNQNTEETQHAFDFNQILNDNGNVVLVDVLDKDGNTKYPDSRLFLIRDAGAKAKVVELKSDGTIVPHAVNKEDVATISSMSLDEYKQAMPESSTIEDNSGEESDGDSQLANLGLPKGSEIWMSGDGFGRPKENTQSKVVGIDEQGSIILEDKDGKKWSASFDYINNHRELPPLDENTNIVNDENNQSESNAEENTPAPEQTPAMTLEDGTIVPMLEDGNPDFSKLTAAQTAELYDTQFGEDADSIVSGYVSDAKKALDKASNMTVKGKTFVEQKAAKDAKEKAIADAQAAYDSAIAIRDAYNERQLAKVEDTADGRKELIEKARRKFARLKSAVKDDAEAVSQLYRDTIGSLLHRLYDSTGIDVTDTTPLTAEEYVASNLGAHSLNYEGTETSKGVKQETGLSREDFAKTQLLAADGKGTTIDALVHSLWENRPSNLESLDTQDIRNALIGVLNSGFKASEARNFVENIRIAQAENILEEQKRAQEDAAYAEQLEAEQEVELKAKSDEKAELKAKSEAKLDNESSNESNDLDNYLDNEKTNDKINDNINVPEDATDENPLGAERDESDLPFSAKENGKQQTTAERAADVEKNKVDDMKVVDNIVGQKTRKAFERLAKMMGANIQWQYSDKLGNGWIQETKDADGNVHRTIFITLDSSITEDAQFIFGHEMTHQIKSLNPAAYNELTQLVLDTYGSDAFDKAVNETMKRYSDAGFSGRARDYYAEEVVADAVGEMIRDLNLAHTLAMKMSHPLLAAIHEILQKIKLAFFGTEYSDVIKNIIRSIEQAYVKTANGQVTDSETGEDVSFSLRQKPEPKKKGVGAFGNIYNQFRGNAKAAIEFLKKVRGGEAVGALHHKDIGDIDLVWGKEGTGHSDGYGLSKLVKYHPGVLDNLQEILNDMRVVSSSKNRVNLESKTHKACVRLTWDGERKSWLLNAFKKETSASDKRTDTAATSLEGDTALSQTEGSAAKIENSSETTKENGEKFSLKDEKTMFGMHNISLDKLRKVIKQGGFAAPSMGVVDSKNGIYSGYGEITLIPKAEKIAKRTGNNIGTYAADAWTPIYPPVEKKFGGNGSDVAYNDIESVPKEMQRLTRNAINSFMDGREANELAYLYLHEKGKAPEFVHVEGKYPKELHDEVKGILGKSNGIYNTTDEQKEKLLDLFIREVYDGNKEEFDNDIKKLIKKDEEFIKKRPNSNISKDKQLDIDWMKEHGYDYGALSRFVDGILRDAETSGKVNENATMKAAQQYIQDNSMKEDFDSWKEKLNDRYNVEEVIFAGYKPDGNRKYLPNTVENAVKVMKQDGKNASVGSASFSHFVASILKPMGTLDQIRKKKGNLTGNYEDVEKFQEKWQPVYDELADKMQPDAGPFESYGMDRLEEAAKQKNPKKYAKDEYGVDLTDEDIDKLNELIDAVKNEKPSIYFETKFMRPYGLDEFEKAIVPNDTPGDVVDALKKAGIDVSSYESGNAEDRQKVTMDAINSSDNIRFSLKSMMEKPEGWKQANKKAIHIAEAIERDHKFSLKNLDGTLIKAGTYFSGGGLVEEGLKGIIDPVVAVEYDEKISGVYRNNLGQHIVTADVRDVDPKELVKQIDGEVEYFHASPVCKNYSQAKSNHAEVELDKETAASTAEFINAVKPKVVTIENVKGYKDSDAMKTITDALDANGYTWDADVYNAADYGGYTNRERVIVRAVRDGKLPEKPKKMAHKSGWYEAVADIIPNLTEKKNGVATWMDIRLKDDGIDWRNIDKPLYVMGSAYADGKIPHAFADELLPTLRTKSGDVIVMPDGKVYRALGRVLARVSGVSDDYKMPFSENLSHTIIGNGIPTQLTEHVIAPLLTGSDPKFSIRTYHGTGASFDKFDLSHALEGDYNYVIFDENNANIVGNTKFSLRYDQFEHDLNQWKKDNKLPKDAQRPTIPQRNAGESAVDFMRRVDEYRKQMALWKTAPTYEHHLLSDDTALGEFNRELQRGSVLKRIAFQDSMLAIRKAQEAIMKEVGVDRLDMAEDAYTAENRSHGKGKNEFEEYNNEFLQPLRKAYHQMKKVLGDSYDNVRIYMMAKHGLERDAQMAFKKSLEADYEDVAQRSAAYKAYKGDMNRIINDSDLEFGRVDFTTWRQRDNALRVKYSPSYMDYRYDKNGIAYDYSGLSALFDGSDFEEAAHKLVKDIESKYVAETNDLWDATNAATKKILRDGYKAGMMSKDTYQYVRDMYSHYIPLRGWDGTTADQVWDYIGGGKGAFNQTLKKAHGRTSIADDPIAYIENMAESGILLNNKNWVKQHLMLLAQNHPTSLLTLSKAWYVKSTDDNGNEEWIPATPQITSQMNSNQVKAAIDAFEKNMEKMAQTGDATQKRDGLNIAYPQTHSEEREHEVRVMKDGEEYVIYVNGDPQLAQAMNNTRAHRVSEGIKNSISKRVIAVVGRKMAAAYTSLSPLFIPSNYFRDLTMTLASTAIREDAKYNYLLRKNLATSWNLGFILRDYQNGKLRDKVNNGNATPKEQMFYDFMMNGGETGFVSSLDVEDLKKKFKNDLKDLDRWKANPVKVGHIIMDCIEFLNRMIEDSNRFAIYMTSIQYGRSIDEAVNDAKDVTLNFNRKGTGEHSWQTIRNLYLFINPAVQSLQTLGALAKHHPFKFTAVTASWLASGVLVPIVNVALMQLGAAFFGGDGDDKDWYKDISKKYWQFTKWDRRNNFIMWVPTTHEFVKIPLAQEFRAFYGLGDMIASKMMGGEFAEESWEDYGWDLVGQVVDMLPLDPTGYDGNIAVSLMPNAIRPVFELAFNVDFTGKPLFKDTEYNKYDPNFTKAYVGTPDWLVRASRMMNSIGNDYPNVQQNKWDALGNPRYNLNNPAVVDHVLSSYLGGAYTMGSQVLGLITKSLNDRKEIKVADIPLVSKFVSNPDDRPVSKKQGDEFWDKKEYYDRASNTISKLKKQAKIDGDYSLLERFYGSEEYKTYKLYEKDVKDYKEARKKERAEESGDEYRPHQLNAEDIYNNHSTPMDEFEDMKLKQLFEKLNSFKTRYDSIVDNAPNESDGYYNTNKAAIDAIDEISLDKQEISELKKGFFDDGKDAYNAEDMKQIRELRKKILAVLEKANKVVVANQKAKAEK